MFLFTDVPYLVQYSVALWRKTRECLQHILLLRQDEAEPPFIYIYIYIYIYVDISIYIYIYIVFAGAPAHASQLGGPDVRRGRGRYIVISDVHIIVIRMIIVIIIIT